MRSIFTLFCTMFAAIVVLGYVAFDYHIVNKRAEARGEEPVTFGEYASGLVQMLRVASGSEGGSDTSAEVPEALIAMLPRAPDGWTMRPAEPADAEPFLPQGATGEDAERVRGVVGPRPGKGTIWAKATYTQGAKKVIFELIRYPDFIFTSYMAMGDRERLRGLSAGRYADAFATVRGMEVHEGKLPKNFGARYFIGHVGTQIHLRVLASKSMTDRELVPFFATLNVKAMNADVIEKTPGLGEVPVIVLASEIDAMTRAALEVERETEFARREAEKAAAEAEAAGTQTAEAEGEGSFFDGVMGAFLGEEEGSKAEKGMSAEQRKDVQSALVDAAKSGNGAEAAALSGLLYGAIADELGKTEMKAAPSGGSGGGGFSFPGATGGNKSEITVGIGTCSSEGGGKFCSVTGEKD